MLKSEHLSKHFENETALSDVSLEFESGEHAAIIGPSGAGKTTLLHSFGGLVQPDEGRILLDGNDISTLS
ncbi:MAG: ATP-binding cassette domain-containing protein, partial [bacterium]